MVTSKQRREMVEYSKAGCSQDWIARRFDYRARSRVTESRTRGLRMAQSASSAE